MPPSCTAGCSALGWAAAQGPCCSPSVRDGVELCRGGGDLDAVQRWGLRGCSRLQLRAVREGAVGEGQGRGACSPTAALKRRGLSPLVHRDCPAEG